MSLLPVITPRTSNTLEQQRLLYQVNSNQATLGKLYDQLSTGRRVNRGSDDPAAAARALQLQNGISQADQLARNAQASAGFLQSADTALASIDQSLIEARTAALDAVQNVLGSADRQALVFQVDQTINRLVSLGNESFQDTYLFGGAMADAVPLTRRGEGIAYAGNDSVARPGIGRQTQVETLPTGAAALGVAKPVIQGREMTAALTPQTRLVDARSGRGIQTGVIRMTDGNGWVDVDLRGSVTMGDIAERISAIEFGGRQLAADIGPDSLTVRYADGLNGTLGIADAPGTSTATQLNLSNPQALIAPPLVGGDLGPRVTTQTRLADLDGGAGIDVSAGMQIRHGGETTTVDLSQAKTLDDVLTAINRSGAEVRAALNPTSGSIELSMLTSGIDYSIGENGGQTASTLGLRSATGSFRLDALLKGRGVMLKPPGEPDLFIRRPDGTELAIDANSLTTVGDLITAINQHPNNQDTRRVTASQAAVGNGIQLTGPVDALPIEVRQPDGGTLGTAVGLIPDGSLAGTSQQVGSVSMLVGGDYAPVESQGALDTLLRLREAVSTGDAYEIERMATRLDADMSQAINVRGQLGFRSQSVENFRIRAEDQSVAMKARMSEEVDADFTATISEINARQASLEASLNLIGRTAAMTVLNFL